MIRHQGQVKELKCITDYCRVATQPGRPGEPGKVRGFDI